LLNINQKDDYQKDQIIFVIDKTGVYKSNVYQNIYSIDLSLRNDNIYIK